MRLNLLRFVSLGAAVLAFLAAAVFLLFPKYAFVERLLKENRISVLAERVREGFNELLYLDGTIFLPEGLKISYRKFEIKVVPPSAELVCKGGGSLEGRLGVGGAEFLLRNFNCLNRVEGADGKLLLTRRGEVFGDLNLKGLNLKGINLKSADFRFHGGRFEGVLNLGGLKLKGGGTLRVDFNRGIYVDAVFTGSGTKVFVKGYLPNPEVVVR